MRKWAPPLIGLVAVTAFAYGLWHHAGADAESHSPPPPHPSAVSPKVLGVDAFMNRTDHAGDKGVVEGIVASTAPKDRAFSLIDRKEFDECGSVSCAPLSLPVRWEGKMPAIKTFVRVTGEVRKESGKMIFHATRLESVKSAAGSPK